MKTLDHKKGLRISQRVIVLGDTRRDGLLNLTIGNCIAFGIDSNPLGINPSSVIKVLNLKGKRMPSEPSFRTKNNQAIRIEPIKSAIK